MTRALTTEEIRDLKVGAMVARIWSIGHTEIGQVKRLTKTLILVQWPTDGTALIRYSSETGRRTDCHGEVLRAVPSAQWDNANTHPIEHVATDLGNSAANIEPNDEAEIVATVKADRKRSKTMDAGRWMNEVERYLLERLGWEHATRDEHEALQTACETPGTEPNQIMERDFQRREAPYYTAASLSAWVVRQLRSGKPSNVADYLHFTEIR